MKGKGRTECFMKGSICPLHGQWEAENWTDWWKSHGEWHCSMVGFTGLVCQPYYCCGQHQKCSQKIFVGYAIMVHVCDSHRMFKWHTLLANVLFSERAMYHTTIPMTIPSDLKCCPVMDISVMTHWMTHDRVMCMSSIEAWMLFLVFLFICDCTMLQVEFPL